MSSNRFLRYVRAADELKGALVTYCHEVKMTAPELAPQAEQLMRSVLGQEVTIFNLLEITREYIAIALDLTENLRYITEQDKEILTARLTTLRAERDEILAKYEAMLAEHEAEVGEVMKLAWTEGSDERRSD